MNKQQQVMILMPFIADGDREQAERWRENKPFILRGSLPDGATFLAVCSIPTVIDMFGFSSSGGPPGIAYLVPDTETDKAPRKYLWLLCAPNVAFEMPEGDGCETITTTARGVVQFAGVLLGVLEVTGADESIEFLEESFEKLGILVDSRLYKVPELLKQRIFPRAAGS